MTEFEQISKNQFFVIDSENLENVESRLYGFALYDGKIIENADIQLDMKLTGCGTYVWVKHDNEHITIDQDFNGCYGLYLFRKDDYFAISNSFWKLVKHVERDFPITVDWDYAHSFIGAELCSFAYEKTLCSEISMLPRDIKILIEKNTKSFSTEKLDYAEQTVSLNSKEGMELLDTWFNRWIKIIRSIKSRTDNISVDLTGGFDSRVILALFLNAGIDLKHVKINSAADNKHSHSEDYKIASAIADHFGFTLNNKVINTYPQKFSELDTVLNISFYTKLGFHKEMYFKYTRNTLPLFRFPGCGGECIRGYPYKTSEEFITSVINRGNNYSKEIGKSSERIISDVLLQMKEAFGISDENSTDIPMHQYTEVRCRNHNGKLMVEDYFANTFTLSLLIDPELRKLKIVDGKCSDKKLLITVIYDRYCPDLLDFEFEGGRFIEDSTIKYAKSINKNFPFVKKEFEVISIPDKKQTPPDTPVLSTNGIKIGDPDRFLLDIFKTKVFMGTFLQAYPMDVYNKILSNVPKSNFFPNRDIYACISVVGMMQEVRKNFKSDDSIFSWLSDFTGFPDYQESGISFSRIESLKKYLTARIDIKNFGNTSNTLDLISGKDKLSLCAKPSWLKNNQGEGLSLQSTAGNIDLELKCIGNGELKIWLRGIDCKDKNGKRFPVWIDFTKFVVDGKTVFESSHLVWHDKPFVHSFKVSDGQVVKLHAEWKPVDSTSEYPSI